MDDRFDRAGWSNKTTDRETEDGMKERSVECKTCAYFDPVHIAGYEGRDEYNGYCVRYPPVIDFANWGNRCWPFVKTSDWCGEYTRHPAGGSVVPKGGGR